MNPSIKKNTSHKKNKSQRPDRPSLSTEAFKGTNPACLEESFRYHMEYSLGKDEYSATTRDLFRSLTLTVRDLLFERWIETQQTYYQKAAKRVYYMSLEFLIGRMLNNALINLGIYENARKAITALGCDIETLKEIEFDAGLGNGGLGRLAACFMDSMATLGIPAYGYGIRYEYGIFFQRIRNGYQVETPDNWLRYGHPWEIERPEHLYPVKFYGKVNQHFDRHGNFLCDWVHTQDIMAMAYDTPIPGYQNNTVINLRLWSAKSTREFNLDYFNHGDYERAVADKAHSEALSMILYPNDNVFEGRELRLKQEYFLVSASLQDIMRRFRKTNPKGFERFPAEVAVQLNDTHPSIAIPELMRILVDEESVGWDEAWDITVKSLGYTNHTIMGEALEKWPVDLMKRVLPRHLQIIYEINRRFLEHVRSLPISKNDQNIQNLSIIENGTEDRVRMANLAIIGSHSVNGVSEIHTGLLKSELFSDFYELWPERFNNKTNGITHRRWLKACNPDLAELITGRIGDGWITDLTELEKLVPLANDDGFQKAWLEVKLKNKKELADYIFHRNHLKVDPYAPFDCQVKRFHEYKRQLLNALHIIYLFNQIKTGVNPTAEPLVFIFAGKAAPGYWTAKLIIKLINSIADKINHDPDVKDLLKVVFLANYDVTLAERIIPAADISEQISMAGTEASGTSNMKFALNGALTIGTLDGANVEILQEVGGENFFSFGLTTTQIRSLRLARHNPWEYYEGNPHLKGVIDLISSGFFSPDEPSLFKPLIDSLLYGGDPFLLLADFSDYLRCHEDVIKTYGSRKKWARMSILNTARMGKFSSDRTIKEYALEIWDVKPVSVEAPAQRRCDSGPVI